MKKQLTFALLLTYAITFASAGDGKLELTKKSYLVSEACTVSVTKVCAGTGKEMTATKTSQDGNCMAAATVANDQWNINCNAATIQKAIKALTPP